MATTTKCERDRVHELAAAMLDLSHALGNYRFDHWIDLTPAERSYLEASEWSLLNVSGDVVGRAVTLKPADMIRELDSLRQSTPRAPEILDGIERLNRILSGELTAVSNGTFAARRKLHVATAEDIPRRFDEPTPLHPDRVVARCTACGRTRSHATRRELDQREPVIETGPVCDCIYEALDTIDATGRPSKPRLELHQGGGETTVRTSAAALRLVDAGPRSEDP